jgi:hypothetical protein
MNETDIYAFLEKTFVATFLDELIPGIFHNLANPLSGILGRSKLLQRRLVDFVRKIENRYPDIENEMGDEYRKLISDVNVINGESDKLFDMFHVSTGKFYAIGSHNIESLNLSSLIEAEMGFADFYLDFKHNVKKEVHLDKEAPYIQGITAFHSMAFWALIRHAMKNIENGNDKTFFIATNHDDQCVSVKMTHIDRGLFQEWQEISVRKNVTLDAVSEWRNELKSLYCSLLLLKLGNEDIEFTHDGDMDMLTIRIPYHRKK